MNVVLLLWRTRLRSSWRAAIVLVVLIGLGGSVTLAVAAGARRTASANDGILEASNASEVATFLLPIEDPEKMGNLLRSVSGVSAVELWIGFRGRLQGVDPASISAIYGWWSERPVVDRPTITSGRFPSGAHEALLNEAAATRSGLRLGSRLQIALADTSFSDFKTVELEIVGTGLFPDEVLEDELGATSGLWFSKALTEQLFDRHHYVSGRLALTEGDDAAAEASLARLTGGQAVVDERRDDDRDRVQEALRPLLWALAGLSGLAGGTTVLVAAQSLSRTLRRRRGDDQSLTSMGCTTRQLITADLLYAASVGACGVVVAVALAGAASTLFPVGPPGRVDSVGGIDFDSFALGAGGVVLWSVILILVGASSWRRRARPGAAVPGRAPGLLGARPASSTGLRMLTGRRGTVSTTVGICIALAAVIATLTFTGSLGHLVNEPALSGMGWDIIAREGYTAIDIPQVRAAALSPGGTLERGEQPEAPVQRLTGLGLVDGDLNGVKTPIAAFRSILGDPWPPIVAGRAPTSTSEILVGRATLQALRLRIGDEVNVSLREIANSPARPTRARTFTIVGSAVTPAVSLFGSANPRLDSGALFLQEAYDEIFGEPMSSDLVLFDLGRPGAEPSVIGRFPEGLPDELGTPTEWFTSAVPAEVSQAQEARTVIWFAVGALAVAVVASIAHTLLGFVRQRRRDFAVLKALGFTRSQIRTAVLTQSGAILAVALIAALPLGTAAGRWLWIAFAEGIGVVVEPAVPLLLLAGCAVLSILAVQGAALIPASLARRTLPGQALHGE